MNYFKRRGFSLYGTDKAYARTGTFLDINPRDTITWTFKDLCV